MMIQTTVYFYCHGVLAAATAAAAAATGACWPSMSQLFLGCQGLPGVQGCDWWTSHSVAISMYTLEICVPAPKR